MHNKEYDYEIDRIKAFCIYDNKTYENEQHFECILDILETKGFTREIIFNHSDEELEELVNGKIIIGELAVIKGETVVIIYDEGVEDWINNYYNYKIMRYSKGFLVDA